MILSRFLSPFYSERKVAVEEPRISPSTFGVLARGIAVAMKAPFQQYGFYNKLSTATQAGIAHIPTGLWVLRIDRAHGHTNYAHININKAMTGFRDPHLKIPNALVTVLGAGQRVFQVAGEALFYGVVLHDLYKVSSAVYYDVKNNNAPGMDSVMAGTTVGCRWLTGFLGANCGGAIGGSVGIIVSGGVAAVPLIAIGSMVGALVGGVASVKVGTEIPKWACAKFQSKHQEVKNEN